MNTYKSHHSPRHLLFAHFHEPLSDPSEEEDIPSPTPLKPIDLLVVDIFVSCSNARDSEFLQSVQSITRHFLGPRIPLDFTDLIHSDLLPILLTTARGDPITSIVRASLNCLAAIASAYSNKAAALIDIGLLGLFVDSIRRALSWRTMYQCIYAICDLTADSVELLQSLPPPSEFIGLIRGRVRIAEPVGDLLRQFCAISLPRREVDAMVDFFVGVFLIECDLKAGLWAIGRAGLRELLAKGLLCSRHFPILDKLPDLL
jgi:hypothetical protein